MTIVQLAAIVVALVTILSPVVMIVARLTLIANNLQSALDRVTKLELGHSKIESIERSNALLAQKLEWYQGMLIDSIEKIEALEERLSEAKRD